jgi:hydroxymethylpyrimidine pyrophosphatase-like HAD family hydrolase
MGNAKDEVKAAANFVTLDVESDGIAYALQRLL